ncbi:MAG: hypothetical protein ACC655_07340, partial [Rhodothermia bacterium]
MRPVWLTLFSVILIAGCDDPSNVGLGLIGEGDIEPIRVFLEGADLPSERAAVITGGIRSGVTFSGPTRFLAGVADDPVFGVIEAIGYVDFSVPVSLGNDFRSGTLTSVSLHFAPDGYVYGDTVATTQLTISDMSGAWTAFGARSDTTLTPGDSITSVDYRFTEDVLVIDMPQEWVDANASVVLDRNFTDIFDGFQVSSTGAAAVTGFAGLPSFMRVTTTTGSADYPMSKLLTTLRKHSAAEIPGRTQVQDGFGDNAILDFDFQVDSIAGSAVSRAVVDVRVDVSIFESPPPDFVRPIPTSISLIGIREDGTRRILKSASIRTEGR